MARTKNRWIIIRIETIDKTLNQSSTLERILKPSVIKAEVDKASELLFGFLQGNFISNSITVQFTNSSESLALLQCRRCFLDETLIILKYINKIQKLDLFIKPIRVCGTLHQARKFILTKILDSLSQISLVELAGYKAPDRTSLLTGINQISLVSNSALPT